MNYLTLFESFNEDNITLDDINTFFIFTESIPFELEIYKTTSSFISDLGYHAHHFIAIDRDEISKRNLLSEKFFKKLKDNPKKIQEFISINKRIYDEYLNYYPDLIDLVTIFDDLLESKNVSYMFNIKNDRIELSFDNVDTDPNVKEKYRPHYFEGKANRIQKMFGNKCEYSFDKNNRWNFGDIIIIYKKV